MKNSDAQLERKIKWLTGFFIFGLFVSGVTAIPLGWEVGRSSGTGF